jgi:hypothetical protein
VYLEVISHSYQRQGRKRKSSWWHDVGFDVIQQSGAKTENYPLSLLFSYLLGLHFSLFTKSPTVAQVTETNSDLLPLF